MSTSTSPMVRICIALLAVSTFFHATVIDDQRKELDQQQARIEQLDRQRWADLRQIQQLNRRVFDLPEITQGPTGGNR